MLKFLKKNFILVLSFALPLFLILIVVLVSYIPTLFLKPEYNFVYMLCRGDNDSVTNTCGELLLEKYGVQNNKFIVKNIDPKRDVNFNSIPDYEESFETLFYLHDTKLNESKEISQAELEDLNLKWGSSPDGYIFITELNNNSGFFFPIGMFNLGSNDYEHFLGKGGYKIKMNLVNMNPYEYPLYNLKFLGWILK